MRSEEFEAVIKDRIAMCLDTLIIKANEYATEDRLHNFKVAGKIQHVNPVVALAGMMAKHTVSVYDLIAQYGEGKEIPAGMWDEKIGDSINYLLLLTALLVEERGKHCKVAEDDICQKTE